MSLCFAASSGSALGQEANDQPEELPALVGDRPDTAESSVTVPARHLQVEGGLFYERDKEGGVEKTTFSGPQLLFRYGLIDDFELRLGAEGYIDEELEVGSLESDESGVSDLEMGFKYHFLDEGQLRPSTAVLASMNLPTGDDAFSSDEVEFTAILAAEKTLSERFGVAVNVGASAANDPVADDRFTLFSYAISLGIGLTERVGGFVEVFGEIPADGPTGPLHSADGGLVLLLSDDTAVDLAGKVGFSSEATDWGVGLGMIHLF